MGLGALWVLIHRQVLEQLGARPVIYGDEDLYNHLDAFDRPFFQPAQRRLGPSRQRTLASRGRMAVAGRCAIESELPPGSCYCWWKPRLKLEPWRPTALGRSFTCG